MNKLFKLFSFIAVSIVIASSVNVQAGKAVTLNPTDDFSVNVGSKYKFNYVTNSMPLYTSNIRSTENFVTFLKFDISSLKGQIIDNAKLDFFGEGRGSISFYYVADDSWVEEEVDKAKITQDLIDSLTGNQIASGDLNLMPKFREFVLDDLSDLIANVNDPDDSYFSVMIKANDKNNFAAFASSEYRCQPCLVVDASPVPEPSSMILGLMSLGSLIGIRRKNSEG